MVYYLLRYSNDINDLFPFRTVFVNHHFGVYLRLIGEVLTGSNGSTMIIMMRWRMSLKSWQPGARERQLLSRDKGHLLHNLQCASFLCETSLQVGAPKGDYQPLPVVKSLNLRPELFTDEKTGRVNIFLGAHILQAGN